MKVRDVMGAPIMIAPDTKVDAVARQIVEASLPGLPVTDSSGSIIGVVTRTDLVTKHARVHVPRYLGILGGVIPLETHRTEEDLRHILGVTAHDLMSEDIHTVAPDAEIDDAATMMVDARTDQLLVVENDELVGILTDTDIIRLLILEESDDDTGPES